MSINEQLKDAVRIRAMYLCEYCHSPEILSASRFTIEHTIPKCLGGDDGFDNLALACRRCNERKYNFVSAVDPDTEQIVNIFNPRLQKWADHFIWTNGATEIKGTTAIGRATCNRLDLNDLRYPRTDSICNTRSYWCKTGLHPPKDDPCES
jgi:hypothetical protein